mmetsp:Transcript_26375/g.69833  ORF Transcript_26375/g.69833 Transcript_26375/m.69833 type:complete len:267 (-) Transcript_26375:18-818(-)
MQCRHLRGDHRGVSDPHALLLACRLRAHRCPANLGGPDFGEIDRLCWIPRARPSVHVAMRGLRSLCVEGRRKLPAEPLPPHLRPPLPAAARPPVLPAPGAAHVDQVEAPGVAPRVGPSSEARDSELLPPLRRQVGRHDHVGAVGAPRHALHHPAGLQLRRPAQGRGPVQVQGEAGPTREDVAARLRHVGPRHGDAQRVATAAAELRGRVEAALPVSEAEVLGCVDLGVHGCPWPAGGAVCGRGGREEPRAGAPPRCAAGPWARSVA